MSKSRLAFSGVDTAYSAGVMPQNYPASSTRYDINLGGMQDNDNPAILVIDSRDRNHDIYPSSSEYVVQLDPPYKEVVSAELVMADIPNSGYVIDTTHNQIFFQETTGQELNNEYLTATIPIGNRSISNICENIENAMNEVSGDLGAGAEYECSVNEYNGLVTITQKLAGTSDLFNLLFQGVQEKTDPPSHKKKGPPTADGRPTMVYCGRYRTLYKERSIGKVIGFERKDYSDKTAGPGRSHTGTYTYDLKPYKYIALFINNNSTVSSFDRVDAPNSKIKGAFCIVPLDSETTNFEYAKNFDGCDNAKFIKIFTEPVPEISELTIKFVDADGNLFNFNGQNHTLMFEIKSNTRRCGFTESQRKQR